MSKRLTVAFSGAEWESLQKRAGSQGESLSAYIRRAVEVRHCMLGEAERGGRWLLVGADGTKELVLR